MLCQFCGYLLSNKYHSKICKEKIQFVCMECGKIFSKRKYLQKHEKVHNPSFFNCTYCIKTFSTKYNLGEHIKNFHEQCPKFKSCKICKAIFKRQSDLTRHEKAHTEINYVCEYCDKPFSFKCNLLRHVKSLHLK